MILLHIIPTLEGGGAERQLCMLAAEQARRGYSVHLAVRRTGVYEDECGSAAFVSTIWGYAQP